jgi:6-phosphogluconolactonase
MRRHWPARRPNALSILPGKQPCPVGALALLFREVLPQAGSSGCWQGNRTKCRSREQVHLFWGDERCVPPDDPGSNYRLAEEALIAHVPIPPENVNRVRGELKAGVAAQAYENQLQDFFCGPRPRFDLVLLGLGEDGHTASLFPGSPLLDEKVRLVAPATASYQDRPAQRVTLTLPAINTARQVLFLVAGGAKAEIVQAVIEGPAGRYPAQRIQPTAGQLTWLVDAAAASRLG